MCHLAKANCKTCHETQTVTVQPTPSRARPNAISYITNEFHLPCETSQSTGNECGWVNTKRFTTTVPKDLCKQCQSYQGGINYRDWLEQDIQRRENLLAYIQFQKTTATKAWWRVCLC